MKGNYLAGHVSLGFSARESFQRRLQGRRGENYVLAAAYVELKLFKANFSRINRVTLNSMQT